MAYTIVNSYIPTSLYPLKAPYTMVPEYITIHNTANDATAINEIAYRWEWVILRIDSADCIVFLIVISYFTTTSFSKWGQWAKLASFKGNFKTWSEYSYWRSSTSLTSAFIS